MNVSDEEIVRKYQQLKQSADKRGIEFSLSLTSIRNLLKSERCYFTGHRIKRDLEDNHPDKLSIDRIDNTKGYIKGNVCACAQGFNIRKGGITPTDVKLIVKGLRRKGVI